ncbi:hypothetical protein AHF37_11530 [Paragonimus kellicotti]|nr:hypothetical protein AHF37_11530 [Paragonimus kellicotti]
MKRSNSFLFYLYVTTKLLYLFNVVGQLVFMKLFLGTDSYFFGFHVLRDLIYGKVWAQTGNFPRVTYCDFETKKTGKNYRYTLQCVLPLNLFLEKVYVFLWFWMIFVGLLTVYSLFKWLFRLSIPQSRYDFVQKFLIPWKFPIGCEQQLDRQIFKMFVETYLDRNGVFILWLVSTSVNELVAGELISALWDLFREKIHKTRSHTEFDWKSPVLTADKPKTVFECCTSVNYGSLQKPDPRPRPTLFEPHTVRWYSDIQLANAIPSYCPSPKQVGIRIKAPDIPSNVPISSVVTKPREVFPGSQPRGSNDNQICKAFLDSSLDSIV